MSRVSKLPARHQICHVSLSEQYTVILDCDSWERTK